MIVGVRAALITSLGDSPSAATTIEPRPESGEVAVSVEAVALNPLDISVGAGVFYGGHPPLPYVPGCEAVGRTEDGELVYLFGAGRGTTKPGFLAERVAVPAGLPLVLPEGIDPTLAVGLGVAGVAAWCAAQVAMIGPGDRVLVLGATGAVGRLALQAARTRGAERVVGAARRPNGDIVGFGEIGEAFDGEGFTVCIDPLWGEPLAAALAHAARRARIVHLGQSAGPEAVLRSADVRGKELRILGHSNFALSDEERNGAYLELLGEARAGRIVFDVDCYRLDEVASAWQRQRGPDRPKVVVTLA